jgi:hypothetical protein
VVWSTHLTSAPKRPGPMMLSYAHYSYIIFFINSRFFSLFRVLMWFFVQSFYQNVVIVFSVISLLLPS